MEKSDRASRRDFLKLAGTGAPVAAVAVMASGGAAEAAAPDDTGDTIQRTEHVRKYLESARF